MHYYEGFYVTAINKANECSGTVIYRSAYMYMWKTEYIHYEYLQMDVKKVFVNLSFT